MLWVGGLLFNARHRKSDLARQSARRKGEAKVGKGGKGEFLNAELILDMVLERRTHLGHVVVVVLFCYPMFLSVGVHVT